MQRRGIRFEIRKKEKTAHFGADFLYFFAFDMRPPLAWIARDLRVAFALFFYNLLGEDLGEHIQVEWLSDVSVHACRLS